MCSGYDIIIIILSVTLHMHSMCMAYGGLIAKDLFTHLAIIDVNIAAVPGQHMLDMG